MMAGCRFDAKRSLLLNYLPGGARARRQIRPLHEVQRIPGAHRRDGYRVHYRSSTTRTTASCRRGRIDAKIVVLAAGAGATPVILQRSEASWAPCRTRSAATSPATASGSTRP